MLGRILRRTLFPRDNQPHARRLFAVLASVLFLYVIAFVGIMETVLKRPISAVLATSGVLAIVLGLALQSTLADVFSGLASNIDRPFGAGDWISLPASVEGRILEINWRAARIWTWQSDLVSIPNSVVAKAVVTNHSRRTWSHLSTFSVSVDNAVLPARVIAVIEAPVNRSSNGQAIKCATAYAIDCGDAVVTYQLVFPVKNVPQTAVIQSELISRVACAFAEKAIPVGAAASTVRILQSAASPGWPAAGFVGRAAATARAT